MTEFFYGLGHFLTSFFELFEKLGNIPNWIFIITGFCLLFWWLGLQKKYNQEADSSSSQLK